MEETPEQVLARLARHRDSLLKGSRSPLHASIPLSPTHAAYRYKSRQVLDDHLPAPLEPEWTGDRWQTSGGLSAAVAGPVVEMVACGLTVFAFVELHEPVAVAAAVVMGLAGVVAASRRVPLSLWWTIGVVLGAALVRLS